MGLALLRVMTVISFWQHPSAKFLHVPDMIYLHGVTLMSLVGIGGVLEIVLGALVLIGWFTRVAAFILSGEMAVAYFLMHAPASFYPVLNGGEAAYLYCFIFLSFAFTGGGTFTVDGMLTRLVKARGA